MSAVLVVIATKTADKALVVGLASAGLSPLASLQSASANAAALLGIGDHVGQIRPGYAADFVAVAADPLADLAALRTISLVVQGGRVVRDDAA